jgi:hypothetical protein
MLYGPTEFRSTVVKPFYTEEIKEPISRSVRLLFHLYQQSVKLQNHLYEDQYLWW